ncbi:potassium channel, sub T, member 2 [Blyttiomyces sp. JEL0837]|nr:potassium channel, sub T, member 2 [Blyttiomyces sp. JEL0837]
MSSSSNTNTTRDARGTRGDGEQEEQEEEQDPTDFTTNNLTDTNITISNPFLHAKILSDSSTATDQQDILDINDIDIENERLLHHHGSVSSQSQSRDIDLLQPPPPPIVSISGSYGTDISSNNNNKRKDKETIQTTTTSLKWSDSVTGTGRKSDNNAFNHDDGNWTAGTFGSDTELRDGAHLRVKTTPLYVSTQSRGVGSSNMSRERGDPYRNVVPQMVELKGDHGSYSNSATHPDIIRSVSLGNVNLAGNGAGGNGQIGSVGTLGNNLMGGNGNGGNLGGGGVGTSGSKVSSEGRKTGGHFTTSLDFGSFASREFLGGMGSGSMWSLRGNNTGIGAGSSSVSGPSGGISIGGGGGVGGVANRLDEPLIQALDPNSDEVLGLRNVLKGFKIFTRSRQQLTSYNVVRSAYKLQRSSQRQNAKSSSSQLIAFLKLVFDIRFYYNVLVDFLKSTSRIVIFMILDLASDLLFCTLYLYELQWSVSFKEQIIDKSPQFLWTPREKPTFYIGVAFSMFNLISLAVRIMFADNMAKAVLNLGICVGGSDNLRTIYRGIKNKGRTRSKIIFPITTHPSVAKLIALRLLKAVLRLRGSLKILQFRSLDVLTERLVVVIATIMSIIYTGLCAFQYVESKFSDAGSDLTLMQCFYFIVVTLATVGYGDVTPKTVPGQFIVVIIILVSLSTVPSLITSLVDTLTLQKSGGGTYTRGSSPFVVVVGLFDTVAKIVDVMEAFLVEDDGEQALKVVLIARNSPPPSIKSLLNQSLYKERVVYLVGAGMDVQDLKRAQIQYASAVYIIADRNTSNPRKEDERNTLRAWAIDEYAPLTPLYVSNLLPETEAYQEKTTTAVVCVDELKQLILGHTTLFNGSATLLINLIHKHAPYDSYAEPWRALYGDGTGNELYCAQINPIFVGHRFMDVSWYLFREFQVILIGVKVFVRARNVHHHILNPGLNYVFDRTDACIFIAQSPTDINAISTLSGEEFATSNKGGPHATRVAQPEAPYADAKVPFCHLLSKPPLSVSESHLKNTGTMVGHILVCTGSFDVFKYVCTLRAAQLTDDDFRPIVFLCHRLPTSDEFALLRAFPSVYYIVGDPRRKRDLLAAGIIGCHKVVIMNMATGENDDFADGPAIMISHLIYSMFQHNRSSPSRKPKNVIIELSKRSHINYLRPSAKQSNKRNRKASAVANTIEEQGLNYLYAPVFASGRVVAAAMLDCILYQLLNNSSVLEVFNLFCGVRMKKDVELDKLLGIAPTFLSQIDVPDAYVGKPFGDLYRELTLHHGIIPVGIYRDADDQGLGNRLPFVFTNPLASVLLRSTDLE